jgi:argininosuccinate lyase
MPKLWGGRFAKETDETVNDFNSSIHFDARMYAEDITGSIIHAKMLGQTGIIAEEDALEIVGGLIGILRDIENGSIKFTSDNEDIHMNIESLLTERIGDAGKRLHTARSRNDQVALDMKLYLRREAGAVAGLIISLRRAICDTAEKNLNTVMPGYTHLQRAQPTTFAHYIMAYAEMLGRDISRIADFLKRVNIMPLGSGAMGATTYPIDRKYVADALGFDDITMNSIDGVSDRDYIIELASVISVIMMHLSRFSEEIILWCSSEFGFIGLDDAFSTGSSIMPQKKNPDVAELVRGKTGRVYGSLFSILTVMKGLPLAYNKDMQEDKEGIFDAIDTVKQCLGVFTSMFESITVNAENMKRAASAGFINATDCADYLTKKGVPFRDAYTASGKLVRYCIENGKTLETLGINEYKAVNEAFESDVYEAIDLLSCVSGRDIAGGPAPAQVKKHIALVREKDAGRLYEAGASAGLEL